MKKAVYIVFLVSVVTIFIGCDTWLDMSSSSTVTTQKQEREILEPMPAALNGTWFYTDTTHDTDVSTIQYIHKVILRFGKEGAYDAESLGGARDNSFSISSSTDTHYTASGIYNSGKITSKYGYLFITHTENKRTFFEGPISVWANEWFIIANGSFMLNQDGSLSVLLESDRGNRVLPNLPVQIITYTSNRPW